MHPGLLAGRADIFGKPGFTQAPAAGVAERRQVPLDLGTAVPA